MSTALESSSGSARTDEPQLSVSSRCDDAHYRIAVSGELDMATAPVLDHALDRADRSNRPTVIVDLSRMSFCDCAGMRVLTNHHHELAEAGRSLLVDRPSRPVLRLAAMTGLDRTLHLRPTNPRRAAADDPQGTTT